MLAPAAHQNPVLMSPELQIASQYTFKRFYYTNIVLWCDQQQLQSIYCPTNQLTPTWIVEGLLRGQVLIVDFCNALE